MRTIKTVWQAMQALQKRKPQLLQQKENFLISFTLVTYTKEMTVNCRIQMLCQSEASAENGATSQMFTVPQLTVT